MSLMSYFQFDWTNWYPDEPNGGTEESCLMIWGNGQSYFTYMAWNDAPCDYPYDTFVCEKPIQQGSLEKLWIGLNDLVTKKQPNQIY